MSWAPFVESPHEVVKKMLELVELKEGEVLYDLGCGDGRIIITAASEYGVRTVGIELRQDLAIKSRDEISRRGLQERVQVINADFLEVDISKADVVTLYLTGSANSRLRPKLEKELKNGARVVSHDFEMPGWTPHKVERNDPPGHTIYAYLIRK